MRGEVALKNEQKMTKRAEIAYFLSNYKAARTIEVLCPTGC
jgi:hypothetical protein